MIKFTITVTDSQSEYAMIAASGGQRACRWERLIRKGQKLQPDENFIFEI